MRIIRRLKKSKSYKGYLVMIIMTGLSACNLLGPATSSCVYSEDLSAHRPAVVLENAATDEIEEDEVVEDMTPVHHQTGEIEGKLQQINRFNRTSNTAQGFTIQVYSGTSREQASQVKTEIYKILPELRPETMYEQPIYRVRVGEFIDRLEAQNTYAQILEEVPQAIVIPTRIRLN